MLRRAETDRWLFVATITLCLAGAVMVFSASALTAREQYGNSYHFLLRQLLWLAIGLAAMFAMINIDYRRLRQPKLVLTYCFLVLVMLVGVFFLDKAHATHRWFRVGPISLQPSELAKLAVILYLAWFLELRCRPRGFGVNDVLHTLGPALGLVLMMAGLAERSLDRALKGLLQRDDDLCANAIADDEEIDQLEKQIDKDGFEILLRFQPVASDLRRVISTIKLSPNIERVGDQATNIAKRARKLNRHPPLPEMELIVPIQAYAMTMFKDSINAYVRENVELARSVCDRDEQLDDMNREANRKLTERMMEDRDQLRGYFNLILVSRALERVGDHATNISEDAVYAAAAEDIRHQNVAASA